MFDAAGAATVATAQAQTNQAAGDHPAADHAAAVDHPADHAAADHPTTDHPAADQAAAPTPPPASAPPRFTAVPDGAGGTAFTAHAATYSVAATASGVDVITQRSGATIDLGMRWVGGADRVQPTGATTLSDPVAASGSSAADASQPGFGEVRYANIYQGVDLVVYGNAQRAIEYDLTVAPGADPSRIALQFTGAQSVSLDTAGNLDIAVAGSEVVEHAPVAYQMVNGQRVAVDAAFQIHTDGSVGFTVGYYDIGQELYIDPTVTITTPITGDFVNANEAAHGVTISGTSDEFNQSLTVTIDSGGGYSTTTDANGAWSVPVSSAALGLLGDGLHTVVVDDGGGTTDTQSFTLDTTLPVVSVALLNDTGTSSTDTITSDPTLTGSGDAGLTVSFTVDGHAIADTVTGDSGGTWSFTPSGLADGPHTITASETDAAGNIGTATQSLTLEMTPPTVAISPIAGDNTVNYTEDNTNGVVISGTTGAEAGQTVTVNIDGTGGYTGTVNADGTWNVLVPTGTFGPFDGGTCTVTADVSDAAGNSATQASTTVTVDETAPVVAAFLTNDTGLDPNDTITSDATLTGSGDANAVVSFTVDGQAVAGTATANSGGTWSFTPSGLTDGQHTIIASETDAAGNTGTATQSFTLDTTPPVVTASLLNDTGTSSTDTITSDPTLTGSGDPGLAVSFTVDGTPDTTATADSSGNWTFTPSGLTDGQHTIIASETDAAGNTGTATRSFTFDTTPPTIAIMAPIAVDNAVDAIEAAAGVVIGGTTTGAEAGQTVIVNIDGTGGYAGTVNADGTWAVTVPNSGFGSLVDGSHTVTADVSDVAGNSATQDTHSFTVTPSVAISTGIAVDNVVNATEAAAGITISGTSVDEAGQTVIVNIDGTGGYTGTIRSDGTWSVAVPAAGLVTLSDGTHTVTADATSAATPVSQASQAIGVDETPPTVTVSTPIAGDNVVDGNEAAAGVTIGGTTIGAAGRVVTVNIDGAGGYTGTVNADGTWSVVVPSGFGGLGDGSHTVTADVSDAAGNPALRVGQVITVDKTLPTVTPIASVDPVVAVAAPASRPTVETVAVVFAPPPTPSMFTISHGSDTNRLSLDTFAVESFVATPMGHDITTPQGTAPAAPLAALDRLDAESGGTDRALLSASVSARAGDGAAVYALQALITSGTVSDTAAADVFAAMPAASVVATIRDSGLSGGKAVSALLSRVAAGEHVTATEFQRFIAAQRVGVNAAKVYAAAFQRITGTRPATGARGR